MNLPVEGLRLDSLDELAVGFCVTLAGPGVLEGVTTDSFGTSSSMEDVMDAMLFV
jgi:hypothetical protein